MYLQNDRIACDAEIGSVKNGWHTCGRTAVCESFTDLYGTTLHWCAAHRNRGTIDGRKIVREFPGRFWIFFQIVDETGAMREQGHIQTNDKTAVNGLQLMQRLRESAFYDVSLEQDDRPLAAHAHITDDVKNGYCIPDSPSLTLYCR